MPPPVSNPAYVESLENSLLKILSLLNQRKAKNRGCNNITLNKMTIDNDAQAITTDQ